MKTVATHENSIFGNITNPSKQITDEMIGKKTFGFEWNATQQMGRLKGYKQKKNS